MTLTDVLAQQKLALFRKVRLLQGSLRTRSASSDFCEENHKVFQKAYEELLVGDERVIVCDAENFPCVACKTGSEVQPASCEEIASVGT